MSEYDLVFSAEWLTEIDKRADELATGRVKPDSWDDVKTRLQRIVGQAPVIRDIVHSPIVEPVP